MRDIDSIDNQMLGAFVDGELDPAGCQLVIQAMEDSPEVRERIYRLRRAKDLMKLGFAHAEPPSGGARGERRQPGRHQKRSLRLAASVAVFLITAGAALVGFQAGRSTDGHSRQVVASTEMEQPYRVILHVSESDPRQFAKALDYAAAYIREHEARGGEVAVIAHSTGIDLMRTGVSPYEDRVRDMLARRPNIHFIACANAIRALRKKGVEPAIIPDVDTSKPALDQIVEHVQAGWQYIKVRDLISQT